MILRVLILAAFGLMLGAPAVHAQKAPAGNFPPGNSGVDQYVEAIPGSTGSTPSRTEQNSRSGRDGVLTRAERRALAARGSDGEAAAELAEQFGIARAERQRQRQRQKPTAERPSDSAAPGVGTERPSSSTEKDDSAAAGLSRAVLASSDAGGMGPLLPAILVITLAAGVAGVVLRRRNS